MRLPLVVMLLVIGILPMIFQGKMMAGSFKQSQIDTRSLEIQNQGMILSNKLSRAGYMDADVKDTILDSEMDVLADVLNGRIVVVDEDYRVVRDTFRIAERKYQISEEIMRCFQGEYTNKYDKDKHYYIQTFPLYDMSREAGISGVMLITASSENILLQVEMVEDKANLFQLMAVLAIGVAVFLMVRFFMKPLEEFQNKLSQVAAGDLNTDISFSVYREIQQMWESVSQAIRKLQDVDKSRQEFVSNVSHELKTPITSIRVLADSLMSMENAPVELYQEFMNDISDEIDRESKIIDDLLSLVKMDKAATELNIGDVNMNILLEQILKRLRPIAQKRNIELTLESMREVVADADEVKFSLALSNLVENAIKYNKEEGWVHVSLDADHKFCYIKVSDSGIGIPEEFQSRIFERFYRVDKARSRETGGTGLGLAITRNIIQMHQGAIKVKSKEGEGTTFTVRIPLTYIP